MEVTHDGPESKTVTEDVVVPDDAVVKYDVTPQLTDQRIRIQVKMDTYRVVFIKNPHNSLWYSSDTSLYFCSYHVKGEVTFAQNMMFAQKV